MEHITEECNRQFSYLRAADDDFMKKNHNPADLTISEMYIAIGTSLLMTRCKKLGFTNIGRREPRFIQRTIVFWTIYSI